MSYSGYLLPDADRSKLLGLFPARYPDVIAHHITIVHGKFEDLEMPPVASAKVVGLADDGEGVQALVVSLNGIVDRPDGSCYHITWSIDRAAGRKPVDSNAVIKMGWKPVKPVTIAVEPHVFK